MAKPILPACADSINDISNICPINFKSFKLMNAKTGNSLSTLLWSKIAFHQKNSKIRADGATWMARTRGDLAQSLGISKKRIDMSLSRLSLAGLIKKRTGLWFGKRKLFLSSNSNAESNAVNHIKFAKMQKQIGTTEETLVFCRILYSWANSIISHGGQKWCTLTRDDLADFIQCSPKTIARIVASLLRKGFLMERTFSWNRHSQKHFCIPMAILNVLRKSVQKITAHTPFVWWPLDKKAISLKKEQNKITNNNTVADIVLKKLPDSLSTREGRYILAAIRNTIARNKIKVSSENDLFAEISFSVSSASQHRGSFSFQHLLNRCCKILADGNWRTPIGFSKHSHVGRKMAEAKSMAESLQQRLKQEEIATSQILSKKIFGSQEAPCSTRSAKSDLNRQALGHLERLKELMADNASGGRHIAAEVEEHQQAIAKLLSLGADRDTLQRQWA